MALNKNLKEAKQLLSDIEKEYKKIGSVNPFKNVKAASADIDNLKEGLKEAKLASDSVASSLSSIAGSITDSVNELSKQNKYLSQARTTSNQISKSAQDAVAIRRGETSINEKSLKQAKERIKSQKRILENSLKNVDATKGEDKEVQSVIDTLQGYEKGLDGVLKTNEKINQQLGFAPQAAAGLDKALQKAGIPSLGIASALDDVRKKGQLAAAQGEKIGKDFKPGVEFTKAIGRNLKSAFTPANILQGAVVGLVKAFSTSQNAIGGLAKGLGMSANEAASMRQDFGDIARNSDSINVNTMSLQQSQLAVGQALSSNAQLNRADLETMTDIVAKTGLQHSELVGIEKLSLSQGKSLDENLKSTLGGAQAFAAQNKLVVSNNAILKEVNNASASLKLNLGGSTEALGKAVVQAKKFGINLEQAESIASGLLDFESSIQNELEAELLTGKNLNLERARGLALNGKATEAAAEVLSQVGSTTEFMNMNVIAQEKMAAAVNMTREELSASLIDREAMAKMSEVEGKTALERYNNLLAQGKTQAEIVEMIGQENYERLDGQSSQEKFNAAVERLKDIFVQVMDKLSPVFEVLATIAEVIIPKIMVPFTGLGKILSGNFEQLTAMEGILGSIAGIYLLIYTRSKLIVAMNTAEKYSRLFSLKQQKKLNKADQKGLVYGARKLAQLGAQAAAKALGNPLVALTGIAAAASIYAAYQSYKKGDDVMSPGGSGGGYGSRTLMGPEGAIQLNNKDTVIAGTDLFKKDKPTSQGGGGGTSVSMAQTNALLQQLINVVQAGGTVTLDGQKVGEALKLSSFQTQ